MNRINLQLKLETALLLICVAVGGGAGCVSKGKARAEAHAAYLAGKQEALSKMVQQGSMVVVSGKVKTPLVPWTPDLTVARAIIAAGYYGPDPRAIVILRNGQGVPVRPEQLLSGEDVPLQAGDVVNIDPGSMPPAPGL